MALKYNNYSSWRESFVHLQGGLNTIDFLDTNPNMFVVQNISGTDIYCSISTIPTNDNYEYLINKHSTVTLGRPTSTNKLHFFNPTNNPITLKIFSVQGEFDMNILKNVTVKLDTDAQIKTDGLIKGFGNGVSLPPGTNKIGQVEVTNQVDVDSLVDSVNSMKTAMTNVNNDTTDISDNMDTLLTNLATNQVNLMSKLDSVIRAIGNISSGGGGGSTQTKETVIYDSTDFSSGVVGDGASIILHHIEMIQNKSSDAATISIYVDSENYFDVTIPSGESVSDIDLDIYKVTSTQSNVLMGGYVYAN